MEERKKSLSALCETIRAFRSATQKRWLNEGWYAPLGLFHEELSPAGEPVDTGFFRFRVQARQVFVAAQCYAQTQNKVALERAVTAWDTADRLYLTDAGGYINSVDREGRPFNEYFRTYEQAFAIFAVAWLYHVTQDGRYLGNAENTWRFLDTTMRHPQIGFLNETSDPAPAPLLQNPHMHLFEALLYAHMFSGDVLWLERAKPLYDLFRYHIYDKERRVIAEVFAAERDVPAPAFESEPGHSGEWIWLLKRYEEIAKIPPCPEIRAALYTRMLEDGIDPHSGLGFDGLDADGIGKRRSKRLWVQCEILKSHIAMWEETADPAALERARVLAQNILEVYALPGGLWHEHLDEAGFDLRDTVPATSLYHLELAFSEALACFEKVLDGEKC